MTAAPHHAVAAVGRDQAGGAAETGPTGIRLVVGSEIALLRAVHDPITAVVGARSGLWPRWGAHAERVIAHCGVAHWWAPA